MTTVRRTTNETTVRVSVTRDGESRISTTVSFLDHMLATLGRYAGVALDVEASGDLRHHIVEDVAISLGTALRRFTPGTAARYASALVPMDDALAQCALDVGGRAYYEGRLPSKLYEHFMRSLATNAAFTLHLCVLRGRDRHHVVEAVFKALGLALRSALAESGAVFSTKGGAALEVS